MNEQSSDRSESEMSDELVDQAIASIQGQAVPAGPPPMLVANTLSALDELERTPTTFPTLCFEDPNDEVCHHSRCPAVDGERGDPADPGDEIAVVGLCPGDQTGARSAFDVVHPTHETWRARTS